MRNCSLDSRDGREESKGLKKLSGKAVNSRKKRQLKSKDEEEDPNWRSEGGANPHNKKTTNHVNCFLASFPSVATIDLLILLQPVPGLACGGLCPGAFACPGVTNSGLSRLSCRDLSAPLLILVAELYRFCENNRAEHFYRCGALGKNNSLFPKFLTT